MASATKNDLAVAIKHLAAERNLPREVVRDALEAALVSAYKKTPEAAAQHITVDLESFDGKPRVYAEKEIVEEVRDDRLQITLDDARQYDPLAVMGGAVRIDVTPDDFGRIAAQTAKQVILQRIREAERDQVFSQYSQSEGEILQGVVQSIEGPDISIQLDKAEGRLPRKEQIPKEKYYRGQRLKVYVFEVKKSSKGPEILVSRTHRNMLRRLLELEVPEIFNGAVEIKAIAREAGSRSKVAVSARQEGIDPVGACVGMRGVRIQALVNELGGEKIDVVEWSSDSALFIAKALSPAIVLSVNVEEGPDGRTAKVIVPDKQLSLAIGKEGQNARLAAKLTGWRIDIKSETEAQAEVQRKKAEQSKKQEKEAALADALALLAEARRLEAEERTDDVSVTPDITLLPPVAPPPAEPAVEVEIEPVAAEVEVEPEVILPPAAEVPPVIEAPTPPPAPVVAPVEPERPVLIPRPVTPYVSAQPQRTTPILNREEIARRFEFELPTIPVDDEEEDDDFGTRQKGKKGKKKGKGAQAAVAPKAKKKPIRRPAWEEDDDDVLLDADVNLDAQNDDDDYQYDPDA